jgi:hypothetical protein
MYERLVAYKKKNNHLSVPINIGDDEKLQSWIQTQRRCCKNKDRTDLLNSIGFSWNPHEGDWMKMYERLLEYKKKYKDCRIPVRYKPDPPLGLWVYSQRRQCHRQDRKDLLNDIGFCWNPREAAWMDNYNLLLAHQKKFKNTRIHTRQGSNKLRNWVNDQRRNPLKIAQHRVDLLNDIGFDWNRVGNGRKK